MDLQGDSPAPGRARRWGRTALVWSGAAFGYGAAVTACALWGLKAGERGIDTRAQGLLACYAVGAPLALLALAPIYRFLMPRRAWWRYPLALVLVTGATAAAIPFVGYVITGDFEGPFAPGVPLIARAMYLVMPYVFELFFFLTLGDRIALPQILMPVALAAWWLAARRARS